ncbi:MAG: 2-hydroxyacyl-CoA dehydratase [Desulfarculaceae bacterium]|nr:2-hydroxyacyl-CoA dehydratase [Desulfarculaceae bacterium]
MSLSAKAKLSFMKDLGFPAMLSLQKAMKGKRGPRKANPDFGPPLKCAARLKEIMMRHYYLARFAPGAKPVAWVTSGAPVELLRALDFYTIYPENHGALCGAQKMGPELCQVAEDEGYSADLCSYARVDLGHMLSGKTPAGRLPKPDLLFCSNNICQTVVYWYKVMAHRYGVPLVMFDTPFNYGEIKDDDIDYMKGQIKDMIPVLEKAAGRSFDMERFMAVAELSKSTSELWGLCLETMKAKPAPMTIFDAFVHLAPVVSLRGLPVAREYYEILYAELLERVRAGIGAITNERKRLMWDNIAIWYKVRDFSELFAARGMNFVAATYTNAWAETIQHLDMSRPFESLAKTYSLVILNNNLEHRLNLMAKMVEDYAVDGLVVHSARSCKPYSLGQYDLKRILSERLGIPAVVIEADITDYRYFSEEQALTRLEAFFEALEAA